GAEIGQVYERNRVIDLTVILEPRARTDPDVVADLWLNTPDKPGTGAGRVQLKQVADVFLSDGRFLIAHEGVTRRQAVNSHVVAVPPRADGTGGKKRDVESFVAEVERRLRTELTLPEGTYYAVTGEHEAKRTAQRELLLLSAAAGVGIGLLLWM